MLSGLPTLPGKTKDSFWHLTTTGSSAATAKEEDSANVYMGGLQMALQRWPDTTKRFKFSHVMSCETCTLYTDDPESILIDEPQIINVLALQGFTKQSAPIPVSLWLESIGPLS